MTRILIVMAVLALVPRFAGAQADVVLRDQFTAVHLVVPLRAGFAPDCDGDGALTAADFTCFLQRFAGRDLYADSDGHGPRPAFTVADFTAFVRSFALGRRDPARVVRGTAELPLVECGNPWTFCPDTEAPWWAVNSGAWELSVAPDATGTVEVECEFPCAVISWRLMPAGMGLEPWWFAQFVWPGGEP